MKSEKQKWQERNSQIEIDPGLDKYDNVVLFPEKLAKANEDLKSSNLLEIIDKLKHSIEKKK